MKSESLQLWCAYPDDLAAKDAQQACVPLLSDEERARWLRFRFDRHGREFLATRALERQALSAIGELPLTQWRFVRNERGKPRIEPDCGMRYNLANSLGLVVCMVSTAGEVGVDVEPLARADKMQEVAERVFSPTEQAQLSRLNRVEELDRMVSLWTLKEAYIKARGLGMALPLQQISFVFGECGAIRLELDACLQDEARWRYCLIDHAGHRIALMTESKHVPELQAWEVRPPLAAPTAMPLTGIRWFPEP
jgi:4'-phosphopantetheinyl transferase